MSWNGPCFDVFDIGFGLTQTSPVDTNHWLLSQNRPKWHEAGMLVLRLGGIHLKKTTPMETEIKPLLSPYHISAQHESTGEWFDSKTLEDYPPSTRALKLQFQRHSSLQYSDFYLPREEIWALCVNHGTRHSLTLRPTHGTPGAFRKDRHESLCVLWKEDKWIWI